VTLIFRLYDSIGYVTSEVVLGIISPHHMHASC